MERNLPMRSTAKMSSRSRHSRKFLGKTTWYRSKKGSTEEPSGKSSSNNAKGAKEKQKKEQEKEPQTVLFVEFSKGGELASRLRELSKRLAQATGLSVKVVERAGAALKRDV